jgi:hypothetical protein
MPIGLVRLIPNAGFLPSDIFETNNGAAPKLLLLAHSGRAARVANVRFEGKNGHDAGMTPLPLVTQS